MRRIRLGTDTSLVRPEGTVHLVRPLRPDKPTDPRIWPGWPGLADSYELTTLEECDIAVLALPWEDALANERRRQESLAFCARAQQLGKSVFIFYNANKPISVPVANGILFAHSLQASKRTPAEIAYPGFVEDPAPAGSPMRSYVERPSVGFCGKAWPIGVRSGSPFHGFSARARSMAGTLIARSGINDRLGTPVTFYHRMEALRRLERDPRIDPRFVLRDAQPVDPNAYKQEFYDNILQTDYTLAVRSVGNFSLRLYETLACGRIPLFVDTDSALPLSSDIDWRKLCIWVDGSDVRNIADRLVSAHRGMTPDEFEDRQRRCREAWVTHLTEPGFFETIRDKLLGTLSGGDFTGVEGRARLLRSLA